MRVYGWLGFIILGTNLSCQMSGPFPINDSSPPNMSPSGSLAQPLINVPIQQFSLPNKSPQPTPRPTTLLPPAKTLDYFLVTTLASAVAEDTGGGYKGIVVGRDGHIYMSDPGMNQIIRVSPQGEVSTFAGVKSPERGHTDGPASQAKFFAPRELAMDSAGNLYVNEYHRIRKITPSGIVSTLAGNTACCEYSVTTPPLDGQGTQARFMGISDMAIGPDDALYLTDHNNDISYIRKVSPNGQVTTVAGDKQSGYQDGPAASARFDFLGSIAVDLQNQIYVHDIRNHLIRKLSANGEVSTFVRGCDRYCTDVRDGVIPKVAWGAIGSIHSDFVGNLYVLEGDNINETSWLRKIDTQGVVTTMFKQTFDRSPFSLEPKFGNGKLEEAKFGIGSELAFNRNDSDIYFLDRNYTIRRMTKQATPIVRSMLPASGKWNSKVTIQGYHFDYVTEVKMAGVPVFFEIISPQEIRLTVPPEMGKLKSTISLLSPSTTYRSEVPFYLEETKRNIAIRNPYSGPLTLSIDDHESKKSYVFQSQSGTPHGEKAVYAETRFDAARPDTWAAILPQKVGFGNAPMRETSTALIDLNHHFPSKVSTGEVLISIKEPVAENKQALEKQYNTKLSTDLGSYSSLFADLSKIDLGKLETNLRMLNATTEDPKYVITTASFDSIEAAKTYALVVELLLDERVTGASFDPILSID